ncbi:MAG: hypothetical protein AB7S36_21170, partial [Planctomycetota bacterium]
LSALWASVGLATLLVGPWYWFPPVTRPEYNILRFTALALVHFPVIGAFVYVAYDPYRAGRLKFIPGGFALLPTAIVMIGTAFPSELVVATWMLVCCLPSGLMSLGVALWGTAITDAAPDAFAEPMDGNGPEHDERQ